ncbi:MAG: hypothetical protein ACOYXM_04755 [Actinomycetota bacterium]
MRRTRVLVGFVLVVAATLPQAGAQGAAGPPDTFDIDVSAAPVYSSSSATAALPLAVDAAAGFSRVQLNSQPNAIATAGPGYTPLADAAPVLFGLPAPPASVSCASYFPGQPHEASCGGPAQGTGGLSTAAASGHASSAGDPRDPTQLRSEASTRGADLRSGPEVPAAILIGQASSAAAAAAEGDRMAAGASSEVSDIAVAGVLTIESVTSSVSGAVGGRPGTASQEATLTISGAEVAGVPVTIDNEGVTVSDQGTPGPLGAATQEQVNAALAAAGLQVRTVPGAEPVAAPDGTRVQVASGGLQISFADPQGALAFTMSIGESVLRMQGFRAATLAQLPSPAATTDVPVTVPAADLPTRPALPAPPPPPPAPGATSPAPSTQPFVQAAAIPIGWRIPFAPFALLALALPVLARGRRFTFTPR